MSPTPLLATPSPDPSTPAISLPRSEGRIIHVPGGHDVAVYSFATRLPARPRILALKLDHLGDFIIGLPSLRRLRRAFPAAHIHLVVGSWNRAAAEAAGVADEVGTYDFFPQNASSWDGTPSEPLERFRAAAAGHHDIAIDLRVDDDTRFLLQHADAAVRCGIGSRVRFPFLDVALPAEHENRHNALSLAPGQTMFGVDRFESRMPFKRPFEHETDFRPCQSHVIFGPHVLLPAGSFTVRFALQLTGWRFGLGKAQVILDVARRNEMVAIKRLKARDLRALPDTGVELAFENHDTATPYEFRVFVKNRPLHAGLRFAGVRIDHVGTPAAPRFRRAELHIGEQLSLLVQLLAERTRPLYDPAGPAPERDGAGPRDPHVVVAPTSNSDLRDWPAASYAELVRLLVDRLGCTVTLVGAPAQAAALERIRDAADRGAKVAAGGRTPWADVPGVLRGADLVICNNSGIAHLAASVGALTLAIHSASHQPQEWGPRGARSHAVMAVVPCSPCGYDRLAECPNDHTCMTGLLPRAVFEQAALLLDGAGRGTRLDGSLSQREPAVGLS